MINLLNLEIEISDEIDIFSIFYDIPVSRYFIVHSSLNYPLRRRDKIRVAIVLWLIAFFF